MQINQHQSIELAQKVATPTVYTRRKKKRLLQIHFRVESDFVNKQHRFWWISLRCIRERLQFSVLEREVCNMRFANWNWEMTIGFDVQPSSQLSKDLPFLKAHTEIMVCVRVRFFFSRSTCWVNFTSRTFPQGNRRWRGSTLTLVCQPRNTNTWLAGCACEAKWCSGHVTWLRRIEAEDAQVASHERNYCASDTWGVSH